MLNGRRRRWTRRRTAVALVVASTGVLAGNKAYQYSADPVGEKSCPPLSGDAAAQAPLQLAGPAPAAQVLTVAARAAASPTVPDTTRLVSTAPRQGESLPWAQRGGTMNDASCLNQTSVYGVLQITSEDDLRSALAFAREHKLKVSIAGVRHSMGGHAFARNALVLDMRRFNGLKLDEANRTITVQSGATWHDIQSQIHPKYAVKAMQSTDIFTVGGSISVNAHGMDHQVGSVGGTIRSMRVMLPDGTIQRASRTENPELFNLVVGGYGLFGIVLDVELDITDNVIYSSGRSIVDYQAFPALFESELANDKGLGLFYGHLSTSPASLLREMIIYKYVETAAPDANVPALGEVGMVKLRRLVINFSKRGSIPMRIKWFTEKHVEPLVESCTVTRNQAMKDGEACLVSRNEPMHDSVPYLKNRLPNDTDILQEYFIPRDQFVPFVDGLRGIVQRNETNLLNASVRVVHPEDNTLNYAPAEMFAVVLYINQATTPEANTRMRATTEQIIDLAIQHKGTFFLPYQLYYSPEQLRAAYPMIDQVWAAKQQYDPDGLLTNTFYERYGPQPQ